MSAVASSVAPRPQVAAGVAARIERLILDNVLKSGQALPSERRLCDKLGVSRAALREGLSLLRARGIIQTVHGRGSVVARLAPVRDDDPLMHLFNAQPRTLYDLLEVRALLEGESARLAALRGTEADFVLITRRFREMEAAQGEELPAAVHARLDHDFHHALCEASHNPILLHVLKSLSDLMLNSIFVAVNNLYNRVPHKRQIDDQHRRIFEAVMARQPEQAHRAAVAHIHGVRDSFREVEQEEQRLVRASLRLEGWQ